MGAIDENRYASLVELALKEGAVTAKVIPAGFVAVDERVRLKCEIPRCASYNNFLTCPPHTMSVERFSKLLSRYKTSMLVQVEADLNSTNKNEGRIDSSLLEEHLKLHKPFKMKLLTVIESVEAAAFKLGMRFAAGFTGGSCILCDRCVEDKTKEVCRFPFRARPSMEGVGVDVFQTTQNAGMPLHFSSSKNVLWTGMILLE